MKKYDAIVKCFEERGFYVSLDNFDTDDYECTWINATKGDIDLVVIVDDEEYLFRAYDNVSDFEDIATRKTERGILNQIRLYLSNL